MGLVKTLTLPRTSVLAPPLARPHRPRGAQGAVYALIALGYTLVYGILRMINFAHGEVFMVGAFVVVLLRRTPTTKSGFMNRHPVPALGILFLVGDGDLHGRRRAAGAGRVPAAAERSAPRPADHRDRRLAVPAEHRPGFFGTQTRGYPRPDVLDGDLDDLRRHASQRSQVVVSW